MRMMLAAAALMATGCYQGVSPVEDGLEPPPRVPGAGGDDEGDDGEDDGADSGEPGHHGEGDADTPAGRHVRRMTALQFHRSLVEVTGQPWPEFEAFAGAMGRADYAEITEEGRELSVTFDKFVHDAAVYSCGAAVAADLGGASPGTILRWASVSDRDDSVLRRNLDYLMLRFLGQQLREDDRRSDPWMELLTGPADERLDDELMAERWTAVCVGLVTHPDFVTY
ncbi:MAG: hypothetical protein KC501_02615 [Myxococcales bacterium]|nr:hypothetical protein [Myxococcales bacterium]